MVLTSLEMTLNSPLKQMRCSCPIVFTTIFDVTLSSTNLTIVILSRIIVLLYESAATILTYTAFGIYILRQADGMDFPPMIVPPGSFPVTRSRHFSSA